MQIAWFEKKMDDRISEIVAAYEGILIRFGISVFSSHGMHISLV
jgi:hypothetical protein